MTGRALMALGLGQCINWGVLYYAFAALMMPMASELRATPWVVTGAFSLTLLVAALAAPIVGQWSDRGNAPLLMQIGGLAATLLTTASAFVSNVFHLYAIWGALGVCMASTQYEPAFAIVGRRHIDATARLRALALVTIVGGLASTIFLPLTGWLIAEIGWRRTLVVHAVMLGASTLLTRHAAPVDIEQQTTQAPRELRQTGAVTRVAVPRPLLLTFAFVSLAGTAVLANLVASLGERGFRASTATTIGGLLGVMQLPGRALLLQARADISPSVLLGASLSFQAVGLLAWALVPSGTAVVLGLCLFATGAGLSTLIRPHVVQSQFGADDAGQLNGHIARAQQLARAAGPFVAGVLASLAGYRLMLVVLGVLFAGLAWVTHSRVNPSSPAMNL